MTPLAVTRRDALQGLGSLALATTFPVARAAAAVGTSLNFLAVGDWGRHGADHQSAVAAQMGDSAERLRARFVLSVGDNFYEDGVTSVSDPAWRTSFEDIYVAPSLQVPWHVALGNHDYRGNVDAQLDYTDRDHRWRLPSRWYAFEERAPDGTLVELFVTDTTPMIDYYYHSPLTKRQVDSQRHLVATQLAWLDDALGRSRAHWKIVIGHHPIYSGWIQPGQPLSPTSPLFLQRSLGGTPELIARLDPILRRHEVALYLNGHNHDLQHVQRGAAHFVCTGAGSKTAEFCDLGGSDFCALRAGFVACLANRERLTIVYRDRTGAELHVVDIPARARA